MAKPAATEGQVVTALNLQFNGTDQEFVRANVSETLLAAGTSLSASTAIPLTLTNARGLMAIMNITTAFPASASLTYVLKIRAIDPASSATVVLGATAARSASGVSSLMIYPGIAASAGANAQVNVSVPRRVEVAVSMSAAVASTNIALSLGVFYMG